MKEKSWLWILGLAAIFLCSFNLGALPLRDWDEGIVATVAREISRADLQNLVWLFPINPDGSPYWNKPPLVHDLIALSYSIFGVSEWSSRIVPSLMAAAGVPLVYLIGKEIFTRQRPALLSAVVYLTLIPVVRHQRLAMLDGAITTEFCFGVWCWLRLRHKQNLQLLSFLLGLGFSLLSLTKGIAIAILLYGILGLFVIANNQISNSIGSLNVVSFLLGLVPGFAWYGLQYLRYGQDFISYNLGTQTFKRAIEIVENNSQPIWYYLLELLKYSLPWLIFLPGGIASAFGERKSTWAKLSLIWFGVYLLVISVMTTKLPWYIMPIYPAVSLLVGVELERVILEQKSQATRESSPRKVNRVYLVSLLFCGIVFCLATVYLLFIQPRDYGLIAIASILSFTFILAGVLFRQSSKYFIVVLAVGLYSALLSLFITPHAIWELAESYPVKPVAQLVKNNTPTGAIVYTNYPLNRPSLNFYSGRLVIPWESQNPTSLDTINKPLYLLQNEELPLIKEGLTIARMQKWQLTKIIAE